MVNTKNSDSSSGFDSALGETLAVTAILPGSKVPELASELEIEHLLPDLKRRTISSSVITIGAQGVKFLLNLASVVILARLLAPQDFGLIAMVTTVLGFLRVLKDAGLSTATIQCERLSHSQVSNLFWLNVGLGGVLTVFGIVLTPVIAWFYGDSRLTQITPVLSMSYLVSASAVQHRALLNRQMRFKAIAAIEVGSMAGGLVIGISMALLHFGYWSLVGLNLATEATATVFTWSVSRWRPQLVRFGVGTKRLVGFGANLTAAGLIYSLGGSVDTLLIGWRYGAGPVGLYSRAMALLFRPLEMMLWPISSVFLPALSRVQNDPERYRRMFLQVYDAIALVGFSTSGILLALAHPLTLVLLGARWQGVAPIFAGLMIGALYSPLAISSTWLFTSQGRGTESLRTQAILSSLTVASFMGGLPFGPAGVAFAYSVSGLCIRLPILYYMIGRSGAVRTIDLWSVFFRHLPLWIISVGLTYLVRIRVSNLSAFSQVLICIPITFAAITAFSLILPAQRRVINNLARVSNEMFSKRVVRKQNT